MLYNGQHKFKEGGKVGGGNHVSQWGKKQFRNSRVLKSSLFHLNNSLFTDLYHVPLVRVFLFNM